MRFALRMLSCGAAVLATSMFGSAGVNAQTATITINGCGSLSSTGGSGNIVINCTAAPNSGSGPSCQSLSVTPANDANKPSSITLTAVCSPGTNGAITTYTFSGNGINPLPQAGSSLPIPAPSGTTQYSVTATDGTSTSNPAFGSFTVGSTGGGTDVDLSACTAQGYTGRPMDLTYRIGVNTDLDFGTVGSFGNSNALVLRFTTPASTGDLSGIQFVFNSGTQQVLRMMTIATQPCQIATAPGASGSILASTGPSKSPVFYLAVSNSKALGRVTLAPATTYYVTVVNRNGYDDTTGSCTTNSCGMHMNFTN